MGHRPQKSAEICSRDVEALAVEVMAVPNDTRRVLPSDIIVTATSAQAPFLTKKGVFRPGLRCGGRGRDPHKNELAPELLAGLQTLVVRRTRQCMVMGRPSPCARLRKLLTFTDDHANLSDLSREVKPGRTSREKSQSLIPRVLRWRMSRSAVDLPTGIPATLAPPFHSALFESAHGRRSFMFNFLPPDRSSGAIPHYASQRGRLPRWLITHRESVNGSRRLDTGGPGDFFCIRVR